MTDVVVVGAGLSGLACAWQLTRAGREVVVIDRESTPGGVVRTDEIDGCLVEAGPNSILPTPEAMEIIRSTGLEPELVSAPSRLPRFVYIGGRLRKAPWVLSVGGTLRALGEPFAARRPQDGDESLEAFFTRRFGEEVHSRLVSPFVSGIWAGDPGALGIEGTFPRLRELETRYGSVLVGLLRSRPGGPRSRLSSFRGGMATLPHGLAAGVDLRPGASAIRVSSVGQRWEVASSAGTFNGRCVVLALPAFRVSECLDDPALGSCLDEVDYAPVLVAAATVGSDQTDRVPRGFGFLVPRTEGLHLLGTLFSSSVFPGRAPQGESLLTSFLGGALDRAAVAWPDDRVWETLDAELRKVLGFTGGIRPLRLYRYSRGIPQYRIGHRSWRQRVGACLAARPGLVLTGNYLDGVSVPLTLENGCQTAGAVSRHLEKQA
jgi:oxygen-dependent protoporphyrinogen oxidase